MIGVLFSHIMRSEKVLGFTVLRIFSSLGSSGNVDKDIYNDLENRYDSDNRMSFQLNMIARQPFNPFSNRQKNNKVRWFEADLDAFYAFVENQPLLTAEQELQYGKAMRMWVQVEQMRTHMTNDRSTSTDFPLPVTDADMAQVIGCSEAMLGNMSRYAEVSKHRLVNSNLKLVLAVVSRYRTANIHNAELIAEGTRGLSKAVIRYCHYYRC
jgi:DNA-directed RNA polymerase sigma subunit (sigma70/sigma32)